MNLADNLKSFIRTGSWPRSLDYSKNGIDAAYLLHIVVQLMLKEPLVDLEFDRALQLVSDTMHAQSVELIVQESLIIVNEIGKVPLVQSFRPLALLPAFLSMLQTRCGEEKVLICDAQALNSEEFCSHVIDIVLQHEMDAEAIVPLTLLLKEEHLISKYHFTKFAEKIGTLLEKSEASQMPIVVYHFLIAGCRLDRHHRTGMKCTQLTMKTVIATMNNIENAHPSDEFLSESSMFCVQGTVLQHVLHAMRQEKKLSDCIFEMIKLKEWDMTPFSVALILNLSSVPRYREQGLNSIVSYLISFFQWKSLQNTASNFGLARKMSKSNALYADIEKPLLEVASRLSKGFDVILVPILEVALQLLDAHKLNHELVSIGMQLLAVIFYNIESTRSNIWSQLQTRFFSQDTELQALLIVENLKEKCKLLNNIPFQELTLTFDFLFRHHNPDLASRWLRCAYPAIFRDSRSRDSLMISLRKALFARNITARETAARGYLLLINNLTLCREGTMEIDIPATRSFDESEISLLVGFLKRSLTQQKEVRLIIYEGVAAIFESVSNFQTRLALFNMIVDHLQFYLIRGGVLPFEFSVPECLSESLSGLVSTICSMIFSICKQPSMIKEEIVSRALATVKLMLQQFSKCSLQDFTFVPIEAEASTKDSKIRSNLEACFLEASGVIRALISLLAQNHSIGNPIGLDFEQTRILSVVFKQIAACMSSAHPYPSCRDVLASSRAAAALVTAYSQNQTEYNDDDVFYLLYECKNFAKGISSLSDTEEFRLSIASGPIRCSIKKATTVFIPVLRHLMNNEFVLSVCNRKTELQSMRINSICSVIQMGKYFGSAILSSCFPNGSKSPFHYLTNLYNDMEKQRVDLKEISFILDTLNELVLSDFKSKNEDLLDMFSHLLRENITKEPRTCKKLLPLSLTVMGKLSQDRSELQSFEFLRILADDVFKLLGDGMDVVPTTDTFFPFVCDETVEEVSSFVLETCSAHLRQIQWIQDQMDCLEKKECAIVPEEKRFYSFSTQMIVFDELNVHLLECSKIVSILLQAHMEETIVEKLMKSLEVLLSNLVSTTSNLYSMSILPTDSFMGLTRFVAESIIDKSFIFLNKWQVHSDEAERKPVAKIQKELKLIPTLIFQIEKYQSILTKYAVLQKSDELLKLSARFNCENRDFRILGREMSDLKSKKK